jgi:hypothetical protein
MNDNEAKPTPLAVAQILESMLLSEQPYVESLPTLLWMLEASPQTRDMLEQLTRPRENAPTLMDLAKLILAISGEDLRDYPTALWLVRQSEEGRQAYEELRRLGEDVGDVVDGERWPVTALQRHREVDLLLACEDDWDDPADVLDPTRDHVSHEAYRQWLSICVARRSRGEGDAERLRVVTDKLRKAGQRESYIGSRLKQIAELARI